MISEGLSTSTTGLPAWEDRPEDLTMVEKAGNVLRKHLAPNTGYADYGKDIF